MAKKKKPAPPKQPHPRVKEALAHVKKLEQGLAKVKRSVRMIPHRAG